MPPLISQFTKPPTHTEIRRARLLEYLQGRKHFTPMRTKTISKVAMFYHKGVALLIYTGHGSYDRCNRDLKALEKNNLVQRITLRPARWTYVSTKKNEVKKDG